MNDEDFLKRWSRRKRAAETSPESHQPEPTAQSPEREDVTTTADSATATVTTAEDIDLATLPPLDSITAATDVTAFLRKGVPPELSREALRRAWVADPAIRDFVGLAENAWDFTDPQAIPGFGPLDYTPAQVRDLVARLFGPVERNVDETANPAMPGTDSADRFGPPRTGPEATAESPAAITATEEGKMVCDERGFVAPRNAESAWPEDRPDSQRKTDESAIVRRTHGSALPR